MRLILYLPLAVALAYSSSTFAQQAPAPENESFEAGQPLGVMVQDAYTPISENVRVVGAIVNAESCAYDETRDLILAVNRGANQDQVPNDGFVSLINHDGTVHTSRWIGVNRNGLVLNQPFGSDIADGRLFVADRDGGTADNDPSVSVLRMFDMETGAPAGEIRVEDSTGFNDIEVGDDGAIYATQTGQNNPPDPTTYRVFKVTPEGEASVLIEGAPLNRPNGIAIDPDGNLVVVNIGDDAVLTFSPGGELINTEHAAQPGSDGLVIMPDGTKYVSSVMLGGVSRIPPGEAAALIATGIPSAASMCFDAEANQLVIPMNPNNALAFVGLEEGSP